MTDFEQRVGLADSYGTLATVLVNEDDPCIQFRLESGMCGGTGFPTPEAARQIAGALLDAADRVERAAAE